MQPVTLRYAVYGELNEARDNALLSLESTLRRICARLLLVGISSDWLFPAHDVRALAWVAKAAGVKANYAELNSSHGHDGFLAATPVPAAHLANLPHSGTGLCWTYRLADFWQTTLEI